MFSLLWSVLCFSHWQNTICILKLWRHSARTLQLPFPLKVLLGNMHWQWSRIGSGYSRDAILVQCVQCSVAVIGCGSLVHVPEALHGRDVPLDTLLGEVKLWHKCQRSAIVTTEQHGATVMALEKDLTVWNFHLCLHTRGDARMSGFNTHCSYYTVLWNENDTEEWEKLRLQLRRTKHKHTNLKNPPRCNYIQKLKKTNTAHY